MLLSPTSMRVFVTSTSPELEPYRRAAVEAIQLLGWVVVEGTSQDTSSETVESRERLAAGADLVLGLLAWDPGEVPTPERGGDGLQGWGAVGTGRCSSPGPVFGSTHGGRSMVSCPSDQKIPNNSPLCSIFEPSSVGWRSRSDPSRQTIRRSVPSSDANSPVIAPSPGWQTHRGQYLLNSNCGAGLDPSCPSDLTRYSFRTPTPSFSREGNGPLADLVALLRWPAPILGVHAPSGAGKSSLLSAGLVASLREAGRPVAMERHPQEPGIVLRLLGDLLESGYEVEDNDPITFADRLIDIARLSRAAPVLVIDQFEDLLREDANIPGVESNRRRARATIGPLLAATCQRQPGFSGPACRWLLGLPSRVPRSGPLLARGRSSRGASHRARLRVRIAP